MRRTILLFVAFLCISAKATPNCHFYVDNENYVCDLINLDSTDGTLNLQSEHLVGFSKTDVTIVRSSDISGQMDSLGNFIMNEFSNLRELNLISLGIKSINVDAFASCDNLEVLRISQNLMEEIPASLLQNCQKLKILSLNLNKLKEVPVSLVAELPDLEYLDLNGNEITSISVDFYNLQKLKALNLKHNHIQTISSTAFDVLAELQVLDLSNNNLTSFQANLPYLRNLFLTNNLITQVNLTNLKNIEYLDLSDNDLWNFTAFAKEIKDCEKLSVLNLADNWLTVVSFQDDLHLNSLEYLNLDLNEIHEVVHDTVENKFPFEGLKNLTRLSLQGNSMTKISVRSNVRLNNLETLFLDSNQLTSLDYMVGVAPHLKELSVSHNKLTRIINKGIELRDVHLDNLKTINLASNNIKKLERKDFNSLKSLQVLDLNNNMVEVLPDEVFKYLDSIIFIDLSHNGLKTVQLSSFGENTMLEKIDLSYNSITSIHPGFIEHFPNLNKLDATGNPCFKSSISFASQIEECMMNYVLWSTTTTRKVSTTPRWTTTEEYSNQHNDLSNKNLAMSIMGILAVACALFALIYYIHDLLLIKERREAIKKGIIKVDDKTSPDYQRF